MALPPLAAPADLAAVLGAPIPGDDARARALLARASTLVRAYTGRAWVDEDGDVLADLPDAVREVVVAVAERAWRNPTGARETAQAIGFSYSSGPSGSLDSGFYLSATDKLMLDEWTAPTPASSGLATLSTTKHSAGDDTLWLPTAPGPSGGWVPWADGGTYGPGGVL